MPRLYHTQTGQPLEVAHEDVSDILSVGDYGLSKDVVVDGEVELISKEGDIVRVETNRVHDALAEGYQLESDSSRDWREEKKSYEGFAPALGAFSLGALEGATLGLSTAALEASGLDVGKFEEHRPGVFGAGEITGAVGSLVLPGGVARFAPAALAAKGARGAGIAAAKAAAKKSGEAGVGRGLVQKALRHGVEGSLDTYAFMSGDQLAELSKGNAPLTAETIATATVGTGVGMGLIGVLGPAAILGATRLPKALGLVKTPVAGKSVEEFFSDMAGDMSIGALGPTKKFFQELRDKEKRSPDYIQGLGKFLSTDTVELGGKGRKIYEVTDTSEDILEKLTDTRSRTGKSIDDFYKKLTSVGVRGKGIDVEEVVEGIKKIEIPSAGGAATRAIQDRTIQDAYRIALKSDLRSLPIDDPNLIARAKHLYDHVEAPYSGGVDMFEIDRIIDKMGVDDVRELWGTYKSLANKQPVNVRGVASLDFSDVVRHKKAHYDAGEWHISTPPNTAKFHRSAGLVWRDAIEDAAKKVIDDKSLLKKLDIPSFDEFKELNKRYAYSDDGYKIAKNMVDRSDANNIISMSDFQTGMIGAISGASMGGPVMGLVGSAIGMLGRKALRERGEVLTTVGARNIAKLAGKRNAVLDDIGMVSKAFSVAAKPVKFTREYAIPLTAKAISSFTVTGEPVKGDTKKEKMSSLIDQLHEAKADPSIVADRVEAQVANIRPIAPDIADQVAFVTTNKLNFLSEKAPKRRESYNKLQPYIYDDAYLNAEDMAKFERYLLATVDPMGALLGEINTGSVSSETVESIKRIYPAMLDEIRMKMTETMSDSDQQLPAYKMSEIAKLFEQSMVKYQDPGFIQRQQAQYKKKVKQGALGGLKKSSARVGVMQEMAQTGPQSVISNLRRG